MKPIKITVTGNQTAVTQVQIPVSGTVGLPIAYTFDDAWEGLNKTAVFRANGKSMDVLNIADCTTVPWELLQTPGCRLWAGVYGTNADGSLQIPTVWADLGVIQPGTDPAGDESANPTLPVWEQVLQSAVKSTPQTLSKDQQAQARKNIKAMENGKADRNLDMQHHMIHNVFSLSISNPDVTNSDVPYVLLACRGFDETKDGVLHSILSFDDNDGAGVILRDVCNGIRDNDAATVGQLNAAVGDIETALDSILAIQEDLTGGAAE